MGKSYSSFKKRKKEMERQQKQELKRQRRFKKDAPIPDDAADQVQDVDENLKS